MNWKTQKRYLSSFSGEMLKSSRKSLNLKSFFFEKKDQKKLHFKFERNGGNYLHFENASFNTI